MYMKMLMRHPDFVAAVRRVMEFPHQSREARTNALIFSGYTLHHYYGVSALCLYQRHLLFIDDATGDYLLLSPNDTPLPTGVDEVVDPITSHFGGLFTMHLCTNVMELMNAISRLAKSSEAAADRNQEESGTLLQFPNRVH